MPGVLVCEREHGRNVRQIVLPIGIYLQGMGEPALTGTGDARHHRSAFATVLRQCQAFDLWIATDDLSDSVFCDCVAAIVHQDTR